MAKMVTIYSTNSCPRCIRSKELMDKWGVNYKAVMIDNSQSGLAEMMQRTNNARTVPQIFLEDRWLGGLDELTEAHMDDELTDFIK